MKKTLVVKGMSANDGRSDIVRIHYKARGEDAFPRWSVARLECNGKCKYVVVLGHENAENIIQLDIDHRFAFGVEKNSEAVFELTPAGFWGNIRYLLGAHDPMLRLPAWISIVSFFLGMVSFVPMIVELF